MHRACLPSSNESSLSFLRKHSSCSLALESSSRLQLVNSGMGSRYEHASLTKGAVGRMWRIACGAAYFALGFRFNSRDLLGWQTLRDEVKTKHTAAVQEYCETTEDKNGEIRATWPTSNAAGTATLSKNSHNSAASLSVTARGTRRSGKGVIVSRY